MDVSTRPDVRQEAAASSVRTLRNRLLDLSARNPLVSFPHHRQTGSRTNARAVNGYLNLLFEHVIEGRALAVRSLPPPDDEPKDERTDSFEAALEAARASDEEYQTGLAGLAEDEVASAKAARIERRLRDRVRESLGLPLWRAQTTKGLGDYAISLGLDPSFELVPTPAERTSGGPNGRIEFQTLMLPDPMERALAKIRDTARTVAEETGVSTLHLAFGFLEWFESDSSDRLITSPLLLVRVDIERKIARSRYQYFLNGVGDEAQANLTLSERLNRDFRIKLPEFGEEEEPEAYLARVQADVCKGRPRWKVRQWVTLAHFPFARLAMFNDLDECLWTTVGGLAGHPLISELLGGSESGQSAFAEEHDVDAPEVLAKVPLLVLEADASQHSAVYDVMSGKNLVIEGPPGTGKSQTITNIIAAALANGKRVLFMADKQAALQVVKDRLDKVGVGNYCLELHSGKARKKDVVDVLKQRLERRPAFMGVAELDEKLRELSATRSALTHYVVTLNSPLGAFGATVHDILWADRRRRGEGDEARRLDALGLPGCEKLTRSDIERRMAVLDRFERAAQPILAGFVSTTGHPWYGVTRSDLPSVDFEQVAREVIGVANAMDNVDGAVSALRTLGVEIGPLIQDILEVSAVLSHLSVEADVPSDLYRGLGSTVARRAAKEWLLACEVYHEALARLREQLITVDALDFANAADVLAACWEVLVTIAPQGLTVADLPVWEAEVGACAARLVGFSETASQAAKLFGLDTSGSLEEIAVALRAIEFARAAGGQVATSITTELAASDNKQIIAAAAIEIAALEKHGATLAADYSIPVSASLIPSFRLSKCCAERAGG